MPERRDVTREHMLAMQRLWREDEARFDGRYVSFEPSWSWPKPAPRPGGGSAPPVLIGGAAGPKLFAQVAEYADGWIPIGGRGIKAALPDLYRAYEDAGRDPSGLRIVPFGSIPDPGKLEYYSSLGITEIVLRIPSGDADAVLPLLDRYAALIGG
jgi:alkanesulfonate monooxygenase SsuD/methylene tetrahydromethanopterin reductase-like flavin-dependent oxidoreductase (luciferase family)